MTSYHLDTNSKKIISSITPSYISSLTAILTETFLVRIDICVTCRKFSNFRGNYDTNIDLKNMLV